MEYIKKHSKLLLSLFLLITCFFIYFINLGEYPLLDTKETMYVSIARDMLNNNNWVEPKLNGMNYYDYPPFLFWIISFSFIIFGKISTFIARIPTFIFLAAGVIFLFLTVSKILTKAYALIITLILISCFGFLVAGKLSTVSMIYTIVSMSAILNAYLLILSNSKEKQGRLWLNIYVLTSISILTGGLFGIIPYISALIMFIFAGKQKEILKPKNIFPGFIIAFIITVPWFLVIFNKYGITYLKELMYVYDFSKYNGIKESLKILSMMFLGFMPWTFSFLWIFAAKFKDIINSVISYFKDNSQDKLHQKWIKLGKVEKFLSLNSILFGIIFIFTVFYGYKYNCLILLLMFPAACITGYYWYEYMFRKEHDKSIFFATMIPNLLFIICSLFCIFGYNFINTLTVNGFQYLIIPLIIIFFIIPLFGIFSIILKGRKAVFISNLILMMSLAYILTPSIFNFITVNTGEADLINFARKANENKIKLYTFMEGKKYSLIYYYDNRVEFHDNNDYEWLNSLLINNKNDYVITEIKELSEIEAKGIKYLLIDSGNRYCIIKHLPSSVEKQIKQEGEPQIIGY